MMRGFLLGVITLGVVLFLSAWTLNYWQAWVFIIVFTGLVTLSGIYWRLRIWDIMQTAHKALCDPLKQ